MKRALVFREIDQNGMKSIQKKLRSLKRMHIQPTHKGAGNQTFDQILFNCFKKSSFFL